MQRKTALMFTLLFIGGLVHSKEFGVEPQIQKYKGRVVLRGDIVKDDSGAYAAFTEQDLSASQMTVAKVMDVIALLPDCDGPAAGALSAFTQVKMEDAQKRLKIPNSEQKFFLSVYMDDIKMVKKKQNLALVWKKLMKDIDIEEPTSFLDHVYFGCTQRECKTSEKIIGQYNKMFESHISAGATGNLQGRDKPRAKTSAWSYDMEGHARKCVERYCELANKKKEQLFKVSSPCFDDHQIK